MENTTQNFKYGFDKSNHFKSNTQVMTTPVKDKEAETIKKNMSGTNWNFGHNVHGMDYVEREKQPFTPTPNLKDGQHSNICFSARDF